MLYVTTRNDRNSRPAGVTLRENRDIDGGFYVPFRIQKFPDAQIHELLEKPFNECVATVLNYLFQCRLTPWDIDFAIGRYPVRLKKIGYRTFLAELWHNPEWTYEHMVRKLSEMLCGETIFPTSWGRIAARIAVFFGIFGQLHKNAIAVADVCMVSGNFSAPISAWYARQMGLPISNIVCTCNENHALWDLICLGQMRTNQVTIPTCVSEADIALPDELERLVFECGGMDAVTKYLEACRKGTIFTPDAELLDKLRCKLHVSVVSSKRLDTVIPGVYRTHQYVMSPETALGYAGLQDYRTKTGSSRHAVVLSDHSPVHTTETVAGMLDVTPDILKSILL